MKVAIYPYVGGFGLSDAAFKALKIDPDRRYGIIRPRDFGYTYMEELRSDRRLISMIEKLGGDKASINPRHPIEIVEIPDDVEWRIWENEDGSETIHEVHRIWDHEGERRV